MIWPFLEQYVTKFCSDHLHVSQLVPAECVACGLLIINQVIDHLCSDTWAKFLMTCPINTTVLILLKPGPDRPAAGALRDPVRHQRAGLQGSAAHDHRPAGHERRGQEGRLQGEPVDLTLRFESYILT